MAFTRVRGPGITTDDNYRVGILTATKFVGPMEASGDSDFTNINATGIGTIDGVKIGDPSGIVTASSSSGIVTYYGDASKLTGLTAGQIPNLAASKITSGTIDTARLGSGTANNASFLRGDQTWASNTSTTINNNADNRIITGSGTADTLNGEANLTYNGSNLQFNTTADGHAVILKSTGNYYNKLSFDSGNTDAGGELAYIDFSWDGDKVADIQALAGTDTGNKDDGHLVFRTSPSQGSIGERLRIKSDGKIEVPTTGKLSLGMSSPVAQFTAGTANGSRVIEIQGTDGVIRGFNRNSGAWAQIDFEAASYSFDTGGTEKLAITSGGSVTVKSGGQLRIEDSGNSTANSTHTTGALRCNLIRSDTSNNNAYTGTYFMNVNAAGGGIKSVGIVETGLKVGDFTSNLAAAEKIKLTHTGHVEIKTDGGRLKIGAGNDLQMYHDNGGSVNHITCVNNQQLKVSCNALTVYEYTGNTIAFNVDADRKIRTNGAAAHGHTGMIYIQGLSDPAAMQTKSNLTVRGEGGNGLCFGTYEGTANYGSWIQAGYVENFSTAVYPLVLNPNGNCVCIGNYDNNSTTDAGLLRVQSRHGTNFYNDCTLSLEHYNHSNAREQKWHFISASNQGTEAKSNSKFRQMAVPYQTDTNYQTWTDQIVYAHTVGHNQYCWYKFNTRASSSPDRGGSARIAITWSTRHAAGTGYGEYSFAWYDHHSTSRVECFLRKQHFMSYTGGSYYGWTSNPEVVVYSCTGGGSAAGFYLRLRGHGSHNGSTYDMGTMHNFHIIHNDNNSGGNNSFFEFVSNASGGPSDASSALSFN